MEKKEQLNRISRHKASIIGMDQTILAAVSIAGPMFRMREELDSMIREVKQAAANISRLLGGR